MSGGRTPDAGERWQHADDSVKGSDSANVTVVRVEPAPRESFWRQPAFWAAILACVIAFWAEREARLGEYYAVDLEMWARDQGMNPPADPWGHYKPKEEKR